jgi:hypothetical protein
MNKCIGSSNNFTISNAKFTISNAKFDISNAKFTISNAKCDVSNAKCTISNAKYDVSNAKFTISNAKCDVSNAKFDASYSIIYKTNQPKPKPILELSFIQRIIKKFIQKIIKLHKFLCYQVTTILILTIILSSLCKCYDVLIYFSFGAYISIMLMGSYGLLLKFKVIASREFNEKYNYTQCYYWKKYVPLPISFLFTYMAVSSIGMHIFYAFLALYYVKTFIKHSITTKYSYILAYLLVVLFYAINYSSAFKVYNNCLKCSLDEYNNGAFLSLLVLGGLIYYFETIKVSK